MNKQFLIKDAPAKISERYEVSKEARDLMYPGLGAEEFFKLLDAYQLFKDGIRFAAYVGFPVGKLSGGSRLCVRTVLRPKPPEKEAPALTRPWLPGSRSLTRENRRAAEATIEKAGNDTPAGGLAAATFLSGDKIAPPKQPGSESPNLSSGRRSWPEGCAPGHQTGAAARQEEILYRTPVSRPGGRRGLWTRSLGRHPEPW